MGRKQKTDGIVGHETHGEDITPQVRATSANLVDHLPARTGKHEFVCSSHLLLGFVHSFTTSSTMTGFTHCHSFATWMIEEWIRHAVPPRDWPQV